MRDIHASWCKSVQRDQTAAECNCARTGTTDPTPPAQPMTAEEFAERLGAEHPVGSIRDRFAQIAAREVAARDVLLLAAARQSWEAERAVLVTEAASATAKVREMDGHVLVPRDPTPEMVEDGRAALSQGERVQTHARVMWVWEAMVNRYAGAPK